MTIHIINFLYKKMNLLLPIVFVILLIILFFYNKHLINLKTPKPKYTNNQIVFYLADDDNPLTLTIKKTIGLNFALDEILDILYNNNKQIFKDMLPEKMKSSFIPSRLEIYPIVFKDKKNVSDNFFSKSGNKEGNMFLVYNDTGNLAKKGLSFKIKFNIIE